jgi:uroporphyrinogen decarboxylase
MPKDGYYFSREYNPLSGAETETDIDRFDMHEFMLGEEAWLERELRALENQERAIIGQFGGNFLERGNRLFGMENFLIKLMTEPSLIEHFLNRLLEATIEDFDKYRAVVGDRVDVIQLNDDMGTQEAPLISPELYESMIKPYQKQFYEHIHKNSNMFIFLHSCGSIYEFIPHLIEIGVDILNPVQYSARNMEADKLKREYGKDLVFWGGGCDTQSVLAAESPKKVREETGKMIDILGPQGGFVFSQVHNIQPTVPVENITAMFETSNNKR